jgi:hypothetical protein
MVLTLPARSSFEIIARCKGFGGGVGFVLPVMARVGQHILSVRPVMHTTKSKLASEKLTYWLCI